MLQLLSMLLFFFLSLSAKEQPEESSITLADLANMLPTTVQSVSVITGELSDTEIDFALPGPEVLTLNRCYSFHHAPPITRDHKYLDKPPLSNYGCGSSWYFNRPGFLYLQNYSTISKNYLEASLNLASGAQTSHKLEFTKKSYEKKKKTIPLIKMKGLHNFLSYEVSARTNLNNLSLELDMPNNTCKAITGDKGVTTFEWVKDKDIYYKSLKATSEKRPNGNQFQYNKEGIFSYSPNKDVCFSSIKFNYNNNHLNLEASDGTTAHYEFQLVVTKEKIDQSHFIPSRNPYKKAKPIPDKFKKKHYLTKAEFKHKPTIEYEYTDDGLLKTKKGPNNHFTHIHYYEKGNNAVDKVGSFNIKNKEDCRLGRVKEKLAPVGKDQTPIVTHRFVYHINRHDKKHRQEYSGSTTVYDALMHKTEYHYNRHHQLSKKNRFLNDQLYSTEGYIWNNIYEDLFFTPIDTSPLTKQEYRDLHENPIKTTIRQMDISKRKQFAFILPQDGNLKGKCILDAAGAMLQARFFKYDDNGNICVDTTYGNLTGLHPEPIYVDKTHNPTAECFSKWYTYSKDGYNLLLTEEDDNGKKIVFTYKPKTDLVESKLFYQNDQLYWQEFYEYDSNRTLIKTVKENHLGTEKHVTRVYPRKTIPIGLPERIDEMYVDLSGQEILLKRIINTHSTQGFLKKQDHYDSQGIYRYSLEWDYDLHGNVILEKNALGHVTTRTYDDNDNLVTEQGPNLDFYTRYVYDFSDRLTRKEKIHTNGIVFTEEFEYDYVGNQISSTDRFGRKTIYEYDSLNRLVKTTLPETRTFAGKVVSPINLISYDIFDHPVSMTDANGHTVTTTYNAYGKPATITRPDGTIETFVYQLDGNLSKTIAANGAITEYKRDALGRVKEELIHGLGEKKYTYVGKQHISTVDPEGCMTTYTYDRAGRLIAKTCGENFETLEYDSLGRIAKKKEWFGYQADEFSVQAFEYDYLDRIIEERVEDASGTVLRKVAYGYDICGNKNLVIDGSSVTKTEYNTDNLPIKLINPEGFETHVEYDYNYIDEYGQHVLKVVVTDPEGKTLTQIFDTMDRVACLIKKDFLGVVLARQDIFYDLVGNKTNVVDTVYFDEHPQYKILTEWTYNEVNQETCLKEAVGTAKQKITSTEYNRYGQKKAVIKPDGVVLNHEYDNFGRLFVLSSSDHSINYQYTYNRNHQVTQVKDNVQNQETVRNYDLIGRMKQEKLANGLTLDYGYDRKNRVSRIDFPDATAVEYVYDALYLKEVNRIKLNQKIYSHIYQGYDLAGNLIQSQNVSGPQFFSYDESNRLVETNTSQWTQMIPKGGFDKLGRLTHYTIEDVVGEVNYRFGYDKLNNLKSEEGVVKHTYACDSLHNRKVKDQVAYDVNVLNQVCQQGQCEYKYDLNGNLILRKVLNEEISYGYDALNRLVSVTKGEKVTRYKYDSFNRRIEKDGVKYIYQGQNEIGAVENGEVVEFRLLGLGVKAEIGSAVGLELCGKAYTPVHDHQGNVACLMEGDRVIETYRYSAFGEKKVYDVEGDEVVETVVGNPWGYASKRRDQETGLIYFGMRYYDPEIGRWITPDPLGYGDGPNLYAYLRHTPMYMVDPYGLKREPGYAYRDSVKVATNTPRILDALNERNERYFSESGDASFQYFDRRTGRVHYSENHFFSEKNATVIGNRTVTGSRAVYMHGMMTKDHEDNARKISNYLNGGEVIAVNGYNTSSWVKELSRCAYELWGGTTQRIKDTTDILTYLDWLDLSGKVEIEFFAHSEGNIVARNSLSMCSQNVRERINLTGLAPAAYTQPGTVKEMNYYRSTWDIVPLIDIKGLCQCMDHVNAVKPHKDAPKFDHPFDSLTYDRILRGRCLDILEKEKQYNSTQDEIHY